MPCTAVCGSICFRRRCRMEQLSGAISNFFNTFRFIRISDLLDILIVAYLIYVIFNFVRKNHAFRLCYGTTGLLHNKNNAEYACKHR